MPITYAAAKHAKKNPLGDDLENQAMQFRLLPAYADAVCTAGPQAHVRLSVEVREGTCRFQRLFICPGIRRGAFRHCRPFIAMGGTFTKDIFNLTILLAASIDANNHSVLLAWAIVESENESSWRFFLSNLYAAIPEVDRPTTTIMSDQGKGLYAAGNEIAHAARAICVEHLSRNVQKNFGVPSRSIFNSSIRFARTETRLQVGHLYICFQVELYLLRSC